MANVIDGKLIAQKTKENVKIKVAEFLEKYGRNVTLAVVLVGENPASKVYVKNKINACEFVGIKSLSFKLPEETQMDELKGLIKKLATDKNVDGILIQLPLPKHLNELEILNLIPASKDVDGFLAENVGNTLLNVPATVSCTPFGVCKLLDSTGVDLCGKHAVIIGRSNIVGKPMASLLLNRNCTVTVCHSKTVNLKEITLQADILVVAIGKANFLTEDMVKDGAIVIDVGINRTENGLVGDVDFNSVSKKASYITPVPGGVGPMTIATLMENTYLCALRRENS